jgi:AraC-like DNA-binding protein
MNITDVLPAPFVGQVFAHKLNFMACVLTKNNVPIQSLLKGTNIEPEDLLQKDYQINKEQIITFYRNTQSLKITGLSLLLGKSIKVNDYGLYGCTLLCCKSLQSALAFSVRYHNLVTKTVNMSLLINETADYSFFRFEDCLFAPDLTEFNIELQCAIVLSLVRQCLDDNSFTFEGLNLSRKAPKQTKLYQNHFQCPINYQQQHNEFIISNKNLNLRTPRYNPFAMPLLLDQCDSVLDSVANKNEFLISINQWIAANMHKEINSEDLANYLCITSRTLRRKLSNQGTNFRALIRELRCEAAKKLIKETKLTIEDVAYSVGFNDVSNFRAAFKKWTGVTPSSLR